MWPWRSLRRRRPRGCWQRRAVGCLDLRRGGYPRAAQSIPDLRGDAPCGFANLPWVHDEQAFGVMSRQIDAKRRHLALYETSCLIYGRTARLSESHAGRLLDRRRNGNRARTPRASNTHSDEVSVMNKIIPTVLLAA